MIIGVDPRPPSSNLNATLAHQIHPRKPATVMAGLVPAIHLPDPASLGPQKRVDHRVELGDDDYVLGFRPNFLRPVAIEQARALRRPSADDALG